MPDTTDPSEVTTGGGHLTAEQQQTLAKCRANVDKTMARARRVIADVGSNPDAAGRRRIGRAAQNAADARGLYDRAAEALGAPTLPPLQAPRKAPAGPKLRSSDEAAITAAKRELTEVSERAAANDRNGGRRMGRGKQALQRGDAQLRRSALYVRQTKQAMDRLRALGVPEAEINETAEAPWRAGLVGS